MFRKANTKTGRYSKQIKMALPAMLLLAGQAVNAQAQAGAYEMVVYENSSQGKRLIRGQFEKAFAMGGLQGYGQFDQANNQCVLLTMKKKFDEARHACEAAVAMTPVDSTGQSRPERVDRAIALTNRGVLNALMGDGAQASADFEEAMSLSTMVKAAASNLERLTEKSVLTAVVGR